MSKIKPEKLLGTLKDLLNSSGGIKYKKDVSYKTIKSKRNKYCVLTGVQNLDSDGKILYETYLPGHLCQHSLLQLPRYQRTVPQCPRLGTSLLLVCNSSLKCFSFLIKCRRFSKAVLSQNTCLTEKLINLMLQSSEPPPPSDELNRSHSSWLVQ